MGGGERNFFLQKKAKVKFFSEKRVKVFFLKKGKN